MKPTSEFEIITPAIATKLLEKNVLNRPINRNNLDGLIEDMKTDKFEITGESIKIAQNGDLLDGQHRLIAIIRTGKSVKINVVRGLDNEVFKVLDTGRNRKASDVLAIEGYSNVNKIASIIKFIINFQKGKFSSVGNSDVTARSNRITNTEISDFMHKNKDAIQESYHYGFNKYNKVISGNVLGSLHFIFNKINPEKADDFCHKLAEGSNLEKSSPIAVLRQRLISDIRSTKKMGGLEKIALVCKTWNLFRTGKTVTILKWESVKEPFPKPI